MALTYRSTNRNRNKARRAKRKSRRRLSAHMVRAIKAISQGPVETKQWKEALVLANDLNALGYLGGSAFTLVGNIFSAIPRIKNTLTKTEGSFIGNEIQSRGFRFQFNASTYSAAALQPDLQYRFTVFKIPFYQSGRFLLAPASPWFDQDQSTVPTIAQWNTQYVKIMYQRKWSTKQVGQTTALINRKFYVPMRRKLKAIAEESVVSNTYLAEVQGGSYYWALEVYAPQVSDFRTFLPATMGTRVYFKDA